MARVSVAACSGYQLDAVRTAVRESLVRLGGIGAFVRPGMTVLVKPNMLMRAPEERAVTTHPTVVRAIVEEAVVAGGKVIVGDGPAGKEGIGIKLMRHAGVADAVTAAGGTCIELDSPLWKTLGGRDYFLSRVMFDADMVIDVAKMKTHMLTGYTGAVKNLYGAVPGVRKRELHCQAPDANSFSGIVADLLELMPPGLSIVDGVRGQEGDGPGMSGKPRAYGLIAASSDPVALDTVLARAMGFGQGEVRHLALASERGLGVGEEAAIEVVGDLAALDLGAVDLSRPRWYLRPPAWVGRYLGERIVAVPEVSPPACTSCRRCVEACPVGAASVPRGGAADFDLEKCISCMCCAEVCPEGAVRPKRPLLGRLLGL